MKRVIADSAAFIEKIDLKDFCIITVPSVIKELYSTEAKNNLEIASQHTLFVESPKTDYINKVNQIAKYSMDIDSLSKTDIDILAKALEYKGKSVLLTDDFSVQNVALLLKLNVKPVAQKKIEDVILWIKKCTGCKKKFKAGSVCPVCGSSLKKSRKRKL
ncbi:NOB1 family endonuclease [Methanosalsum natronophilum]|nr:NOB1 family endonuclease [Methanosalsum natronophilum]MCS3924344.1 UPF0271 protein [Methanosalsum natronophilum]